MIAMEMELFHLYTLCAILLVSTLYLLLQAFAGGRHNLPPGPRPLPLVGNLLGLGAHPHRSLARLAARHGPLMALRLGAVTTVVASSADAARDVLQRSRWRALRKLCSADKMQQLVYHVARLGGEGTAVDVGRVAFTTALNLISCAIFSSDLEDRGASGAFKGVIEEFTVAVGVPNVSDFFPVLASLDPQRLTARLGKVFKKFHAIFDEQIERRMKERAAGEPPKNDFLDLLLDYRGAEDAQGC